MKKAFILLFFASMLTMTMLIAGCQESRSSSGGGGDDDDDDNGSVKPLTEMESHLTLGKSATWRGWYEAIDQYVFYTFSDDRTGVVFYSYSANPTSTPYDAAYINYWYIDETAPIGTTPFESNCYYIMFGDSPDKYTYVDTINWYIYYGGYSTIPMDVVPTIPY